ncbi:MAG: hypothetical protein OQJ95_09870 [Kangiella sp.]|nr:hypothetical protein [Kangiella sp.]
MGRYIGGGNNKKTVGRIIAEWTFMILIFSLLFLTTVGYILDVKITVQYHIGWKILFLVIFLALITSVFKLIICRDSPLKFSIRSLKSIAFLLIAVFGFSVITGYALFSGLPGMLHYLSNNEGTMEVTIIGKEPWHTKQKCSPRLVMKEFSFYRENYVCPGKEAYDALSIGDKLILTGSISSYGIKISGYSALDNTRH